MNELQTIGVRASEEHLLTGEAVTADHFGGVYVGFRNIERFDAAFEAAGMNLVRWPGGTAAERADWYGLEFADLVDPNSNKTGLSEVMGYVVENGLSLSIIIPTVDFVDSPEAAREQMRSFLDRLADGSFGELPDRLILELGNEHYAQSEFSRDAGAYGEVANALLEEIARFVDENPDGLGAMELETSVQLGRTAEDNNQIIEAMSTEAIEFVDMLVFHRFAWSLDDADALEGHLHGAIDAWIGAGANADVDVFMSGWNTASWTREEALRSFVSTYYEAFGVQIDPADIDLENRDHRHFEEFWQNGQLTSPDGVTIDTRFGLANRDYGLAHASSLIEIFACGLEVGVDVASLYGVDIPYPGGVSFGDQLYVGSTMLGMMSETLVGTRLLDIDLSNRRDGSINMRAFEGDGRVVIYLSADEFSSGQLSLEAILDLSDLGYTIEGVSARSLTSSLDPDWMSVNGITDNAEIDEAPEARLYEIGVITDIPVSVVNGNLNLAFTESFEVIEVIIETGTPVAVSDPIEGLTIVGSDNADTLTGGQGDDVLEGGAGTDLIFGAAGDDTIFGGSQSDTIYAGLGDDTVYSGAGQDVTYLGSGNDYFQDAIQSSAFGADVVHGEGGNDVIYLNGGDDTAFGGSGNDTIDAGEGDDEVFGDAGNDTIFGGAGNDIIYGGTGSDNINGGAGDDHLYLDEMDAVVDGGDGIDTADFSGSNAPISLSENRLVSGTIAGEISGIEVIVGSEFDDVFEGGISVAQAFGGEGQDQFSYVGGAGTQVFGGEGDDTIFMASGSEAFGGNGNDTIRTGYGDELVDGGAGDDTFIILSGNDVVTTGAGSDHIQITNSFRAESHITITDFDVNEDRLSLIDVPAGGPNFGKSTDVRAGTLGSARQEGEDLVLTLGDDFSITLLDVTYDDYFGL